MREADIEFDGIFTSLFRYFYRRRKPTPLEQEEPRLKWMPKYSVEVHIPSGITGSTDPSDALEARLGSLGFELSHWTREQVCFTRGKSWGDFSMKFIRLRLSFPTPLAERSPMLVEVADVCLFDTGDLWRLCHEIEGVLAE